MKKSAILFFLLLYTFATTAQEGFRFDKNDQQKVVVPFTLINNLIFIPIKVNGVELNFLLDTGVEETILFSLEDKGDVSFFNVKKIRLTGLGKEDAIEGLRSAGNTLSCNGLTDKNHELCIVLDETFNFSSQIGIPVNGIIGYHFFKNNLVEINYSTKKIIVHKTDEKIRAKLNEKYRKSAILLEKNKPYTNVEVTVADNSIGAKLLIDIGNSDALWLFADKSDSISVPERNFEDFLGRGFSGDIHGRRARILDFDINGFHFEKPLAAFPDSVSIRNINMVEKRVGSIGGELLKRFNIVFDYPNNAMYLRKNKNYDLPFNYDMSGIQIHHEGMTWVKETISLQTEKKSTSSITVYDDPSKEFNYKFELKPVYQILSVRKDSPAELCGLKKGDIIASINGIQSHRLSLQQMNAMMKSEEGRLITIEVERHSAILRFKFRLKSIL